MSLTDAIDAGLEFLLARQSPQGCWTDWRLPPGESSVWTTAYVGYRLSAVRGGGGCCRDRVRPALRKAAGWLVAHEFAGGGWGYVEDTGPDADSTALAMLFLSSQGVSVSPLVRERLRAFQCDNGGFATFSPGQSFGTWVRSHPDVSATAVAALLATGPRSDDCAKRGLAYCQKQVTAAGLWNSFWWESPLYATEANLGLRRQANVEHDPRATLDGLSRIRPKNCFERALLVLSLLHAGAAVDALQTRTAVAVLCSAQADDGSWPSAPILRLTARDCAEPWAREDAGPLFADENRLFTSATAVAALSASTGRASQIGSP